MAETDVFYDFIWALETYIIQVLGFILGGRRCRKKLSKPILKPLTFFNMQMLLKRTMRRSLPSLETSLDENIKRRFKRRKSFIFQCF